MGCAVGSFMTGVFLDYYQYQPPENGVEVAQSETTLNGLKMMMSFIPATCLIIAAVCLTFYGINEKLLKQIEHDLQERKSTST